MYGGPKYFGENYIYCVTTDNYIYFWALKRNYVENFNRKFIEIFIKIVFFFIRFDVEERKTMSYDGLYNIFVLEHVVLNQNMYLYIHYYAYFSCGISKGRVLQNSLTLFLSESKISC